MPSAWLLLPRAPASLADLMGGQAFSEFTALSVPAQRRLGDGLVRRRRAGDPQVAAPGRQPSPSTPSWPGSRSATSACCTCAGPRRAWACRTATRTRSATAVRSSPITAPSTRRTGSASCCPPDWERQLTGTTDSERYFLHLMWRLGRAGRRHGGGHRRHHGGHRGAVRAEQPERDPAGPGQALRHLLARPGQGARAAAAGPRGYADRPDDIACYFDLAYRATADSVVVASSGWPMPGWTPLPRRHVLVTDRVTLHTSVLALEPPAR